MNPIQQQAPFSAYVVPPPTQQPLYPPNNFVSLQKQTDPHPPFDSTLSEHPPTSPPLPQPPYIHPQGVEPITPSLRQPYYPVLEGYQYLSIPLFFPRFFSHLDQSFLFSSSILLLFLSLPFFPPSTPLPLSVSLTEQRYPTDMSATLLSFGDHHLDEEEDQLLS